VPLPLKQQHRRSALMATIDRLNRHYGSGTVQWAAAGLQTPWRMRRSRLSGAATTQLAAIPVVQAR
jgi:DNA polymerase V